MSSCQEAFRPVPSSTSMWMTWLANLAGCCRNLCLVALALGMLQVTAWGAAQPLVLVADFTATPTQGTNPLTVAFSDTSTGAAVTSWVWVFGDGGVSAEQNPTHTYMSPGTFGVTLVVAAGTQTETLTKPGLITVAPAVVVVDFSASQTQGDVIMWSQFTDLTTGGTPTAWLWDFGDGKTSTEQHPLHGFWDVGTFDVQLKVWFGGQIEELTKVAYVTVDPTWILNGFTATPSLAYEPVTVNFTDTSTAGGVITDWSWNFGDGGSSTLKHPSHTYMSAGNYSVTHTVSVGNQVDVITKTDLITVLPIALAADFTATPTAGTNALTVSFSDTSTGAQPTNWLWDFGDGSTSSEESPVHTFTSAVSDSFDVTLTISNGPVNDTVMKPGFITVTPAPLVVDFDATPTTGTSALAVSFTETSTGGTTTSWLWDFGDGTTGVGQNPIHVYSVDDATSFSVSLTAFIGEQSGVRQYTNLISVSPGPFSVSKVITTTSGSDSMEALDIDGDGDVDLLSIDENTLAWYQNTDGLGAFGSQQIIATNLFVSVALSGADLDGDGDVDVLCASQFSDGIAWRENLSGQGDFGPQQLVTPLSRRSTSLKAADLDTDGDLDVLTAISSGDVWLAWYANLDGQASFGPEQVLSSTHTLAHSVHAPDLDADGDADVVFSWSGGLEWMENVDGSATFAPSQLIGTGSTGVAIVDLDGDADLDIITLSNLDDQIDWHEHLDGLGTFAGPQLIATIPLGSSFDEVFSADLDGDGDADVLASTRFQYRIDRFENLDGQGSFGPRQLVTGATNKASVLVAADLDGDGDADVISEDFFPPWIFWCANNLASPEWPYLGDGMPGTGGIPVLSGSGTMGAGQAVTIQLSNVLPNSLASLVVGDGLLEQAFKGGVLVPEPDAIFSGLPVDGAGELTLSTLWPPGIPPGSVFWFQYWIADPGGPVGFAASNALSGTVSP